MQNYKNLELYKKYKCYFDELFNKYNFSEEFKEVFNLIFDTTELFRKDSLNNKDYLILERKSTCDTINKTNEYGKMASDYFGSSMESNKFIELLYKKYFDKVNFEKYNNKFKIYYQSNQQYNETNSGDIMIEYNNEKIIFEIKSSQPFKKYLEKYSNNNYKFKYTNFYNSNHIGNKKTVDKDIDIFINNNENIDYTNTCCKICGFVFNDNFNIFHIELRPLIFFMMYQTNKRKTRNFKVINSGKMYACGIHSNSLKMKIEDYYNKIKYERNK